MYLIIGGNGFFGTYLIQSILKQTKEQIIAVARNITECSSNKRIRWVACDITDCNAFNQLVDQIRQMEKVRVFFLAACHNPDIVEQNTQYAWNINVTALSECINKLRFVDRLVYASTDSVYGNSIENYHFRESDCLQPVNEYGKQKAAAEAVVRYAGFHVVRYPFLIAPSLAVQKKHFYDEIVSDLLAGREVSMFCDSFRSSLSFRTAADLTVHLSQLEVPFPNIINICGDQDLSKYDIGLRIADQLGIPGKLVKAVKMSENKEIFQAQRAVSTLMDNSLVKSVLQLERIDFTLE